MDTGVNIDKLLETDKMVEKIVVRRLRSETVKSGRIPKTLTGR